MKHYALLMCMATIIGCGANTTNKTKMNSDNLPDGWMAGEFVPDDLLYSEPAESPEPNRIRFVGLSGTDTRHRFYSIPFDTSIAEVIRVFKVGSHGAASHSYDTDETINLVAEKANKIGELVPCRLTFADAAGLKLKFLRAITDEDLEQLTLLFPEDEGFQSGAEGYIIEQEPGRHLFQRVKDENLFHFWWD